MLLNTLPCTRQSPTTKNDSTQNINSAEIKKPHKRQSNVYTKKVETRVDLFTLTFAQLLAYGKLQYLIIPFILCKPPDSSTIGERVKERNIVLGGLKLR